MKRSHVPTALLLTAIALPGFTTGCTSPGKTAAKAAGHVAVEGARATAKGAVQGAKLAGGAAGEVTRKVVGRDDGQGPPLRDGQAEGRR